METEVPFPITPVEYNSPRPLVRAKGWVLPQRYQEFANIIANYPLDPDQVWILGFPRSGTTMIQELVWLVKNEADFEGAKIPSQQRVLFLDSCFLRQEPMPGDPELIDKTRKVIKTHLAVDLLPQTLLDSNKVIFIARNPKDAAVSMFHFRPQTDNFEAHWKQFEEDKGAFGPFWEYILHGWALRNHKNFLFLFYEDTQRDMRETIIKIATHLNKNLTENQITEIENYMKIGNFKENKAVNHYFLKESGEIKHDFVRKGGIGGWRNFFTKEMEDSADAWMKRNTTATDFQFPEH